MDTLKNESFAHLRHELRTPVNHILGYVELLIEDASARNLEAFIPSFQEIQSGGHRLLESIQTTLDAKAASVPSLNLDALKESLRGTAAEALETSTSVLETLEEGHRQTVADLDAISWALRRLMEFAGDPGEAVAPKPSKTSRGIDAPSEDTGLAANRRHKGKILIADDDRGNRDLLRRRLEFEGHHVVEARNGLEVLDLLKHHDCDLVLLDIMMPELDGFQTLAKMKLEPHLQELPVIMISALDDLRSVVRCIEMGADDYLPKPFNRVLLRARIGASLEKKRLRDREHRRTEALEQTLRLLEKAQAQLAEQASHDALTGLANRRSVDAHLEARSRRDTTFSVFYIDLNGFKKVNDNYGHHVGDDLLRQVGSRLRLAFRATDLVGRWGGDEFVALVDANLGDTHIHVSRITEQFSREFVIEAGELEHRVSVSAAVGVATWRPGETVIEVLQRADSEMYEQKLRNTP
jgi:diguanylate cyclase (GGDEF)-like protein